MTTKFGPFIIGDPSEYLDWVAEAGCSSMLVHDHDSRGTLELCTQACPNVIYRADPGTDWRSITPRQFMQTLPLDKLADLGLWWMGPNEPVLASERSRRRRGRGWLHLAGASDAQRFSDWYVEWRALMPPKERLIFGSFPTGTPALWLWPQMLPGIGACQAIGKHEYACRYAGLEMMKDHTAVYALLPAEYRRPFFLNEWGWDENGDPKTGGFAANISDDEFLGLIRTGLHTLLEDFVTGVNLFCIGGNWDSFQWWCLRREILAITREPVPPAPPTPPAPDVGAPTIEYFRAEPALILRTGSAQLEWGKVEQAERADIAPGIGGVGTPGSCMVRPPVTTEYTLTAKRGDMTTKAQATVTVKQVPPSNTIDPRLEALGVYVLMKPNPQYMVRGVAYLDEHESNGDHTLYFKVLDPGGNPLPNVVCYVDYPQDPAEPHVPFATMTDENGEANCPLYASFDPVRKDGAYWCWLEDDEGSDSIRGMGLPLNRHVVFIGTWVVGNPPAPRPTLEETVRAAAALVDVLPINDQTALYWYATTQARPDPLHPEVIGLGYPQSDEFEVEFEGETYVAQVWQKGIAYVKKNDWEHCQWMPN